MEYIRKYQLEWKDIFLMVLVKTGIKKKVCWTFNNGTIKFHTQLSNTSKGKLGCQNQ